MIGLARMVRPISTSISSSLSTTLSPFSCPSFTRQFSALPSRLPFVTLQARMLLQSNIPVLTTVPTAGIKHMVKMVKRCRHCYFSVKDEQKYVMCTANPRHYAAQKLVATKFGNYIMTHATQGSQTKGKARGSRHMKTQASFRLEY